MNPTNEPVIKTTISQTVGHLYRKTWTSHFNHIVLQVNQNFMRVPHITKAAEVEKSLSDLENQTVPKFKIQSNDFLYSTLRFYI